MKRVWNHVTVLALAVTASCFCSGCLDIFATAVGYHPDKDIYFYTLRCEGGTLQLYEVNEIGDSALSRNAIGSPLNGLNCSHSTEFQNKPLKLSQVKVLEHAASGNLEAVNGPAPRPAEDSTSLLDHFPVLESLLFPPLFPASDAGKTMRDCLPSYGAYIVQHAEGTVVSVGICPMRRLQTISVRSNPLELALTPDGSTLLVTSYDSAVTFIDTATDTVAYTLETPGYNPSGIAISPDGTRAYVTHYLDRNPALLVIDIPNRKLLSTIPLTLFYPRSVFVTPDGSQAWVNYYDGQQVTIVDLLSETVSSELFLGLPVSAGMAFNPTGTKAFIAAGFDRVFVVDTSSLSTLAQITVGDAPLDVVATPDGSLVLVNSESLDGVWIIDAVKNKLAAAPENPSPGGSMGLGVF